jgi:PiT family inorganic phosphate transporter
LTLVADALVVTAFAFAFSMGAHYTGACMGMSYATRAIRPLPALLLMAPLTFVGAVFAGPRVETTVGHGLLASGSVPLALALAIVGSAFALTSLYNVVKIPTSTIQILVFAVVGAGLAQGLAVDWVTVEALVGLWVLAPFVAFAAGFVLIRAYDRSGRPKLRGRFPGSPVAFALLTVGSAASFAMGANDVSNATGSFLMTGLFTPEVAAAIGGLGLALGVVTWGRPLLERVAFTIVKLDEPMATASQFAQAAVILASVAFGFFTSMNQALVGAMIGTGVARGHRKDLWKSIRGILLGWAVGPLSGFALGAASAFALVRLLG